MGISREETIDWAELATRVGADSMGYDCGGTVLARAAIVELVGHEALRQAVDTYLRREPGAELARSVLRLLRPASAVHECIRRYDEASDAVERQDVMELLRAIPHDASMQRIADFLTDTDEGVRTLAVWLIQELIEAGVLEADRFEAIVAHAVGDPSPQMQNAIANARELIRRLSAGHG